MIVITQASDTTFEANYARRFEQNALEAMAQSQAVATARAAQIEDISAQLEDVWEQLRALRPLGKPVPSISELANFRGNDEVLQVSARIVEKADALGDFEARIRAQFDEELIELNAARMPAEIMARLATQKADTLARAKEFKGYVDTLRASVQNRSSGQSASGLRSLMEWQGTQSTARGFQSRGNADLAKQFLKQQQRAQPSAMFGLRSDATSTSTPTSPTPTATRVFTDPPTPADLAETVEVRFSSEVNALAAQLATPVAIFKYVHNELEFVPTWGATQSAAMTLKNKKGSAADIASLTLALLRKTGVPARYAHGLVDVPIDRLQNWLDVKSPTLALELLQGSGVPAVGVTLGGRLASVRMEHVWVEAYVDFIPSRGELNRVPDQWVPVDISYKQYTVLTPLPILRDTIPERLAATRAFVQSAQVEAIGRVRGFDFDALNASTQAMVKDKIGGYLAANPDAQGEQLYERRVVQRDESTFLSGALPLALRSSTIQRYSELPDNLRHKLQIQFYADLTSLNNDSPSEVVEVPLARIGTNSVSIDYDPASAADAQALNSAASSNATALNPSLINLRTRFKAGADTLLDAGSVRMGTSQYYRAEIRFPNGYIGQIEAYKVIAGSPTVLVFDQAGITPQRTEKEAQALPAGAALYDVKQALYLGGLLYWTMHNWTDDQLARSIGGRAQRLPSLGSFSMPYQIRYFFGIARTGFQIGRQTDVKAVRTMLAVDAGWDLAALATKIGAFGSMGEGANWALLNGAGNQGYGLTTSTILRQAMEEGQPLYQINRDNLEAALATMEVSPDTRTEIRDSVSQGLIVVAPQKDVRYRNWKGTGYVVFDPRSGSSLQRVEGGLAGGIDWGCVAVAISLKILCDSKILAKISILLAALGARLIARGGLAPILAALTPGIGVVFAILTAVEIAIAIAQAVAKFDRWVKSIMAGIETLTPEEMRVLGVQAINEIACNYSPACMAGIPGIPNAGEIADIIGIGPNSGSDSRGSDGPLLGNPVAAGSGAKWQYDQDYEAEGPFPLTFTRSYNSQAPRTASFIGAKWTGNYFQSLRAAENADGSREELPNALMITRPEGGWYQFDRQANNLYITKGNLPGSVERLTTGGNLSGWRYRTQLDTLEEFDVDGRLLSIKDRAGLVHTLSYDTQKRVTQVEDSYGRTLKFSYGTDGYLQSLTDPSNRVTRYTHNEDGNLTQIDYFDASNKKYHYEDLENRFAITGMTDERGVRVTNYTYNDSGKVKEYKRAGDVERHQLRYEGNKTTVIDPLGTTRTYEYQIINDRPYVKAVTQPCSACGSDVSAKTYDARGLIDSETDFRGTVTKYERDSRAQITRLVEAQGKPEQRVTVARYESQWHLPNRVEEPIASGIRLRELTYDSEGNATSHKVTVGSEVRTTTRTFNSNGQMLTEDGPRSDVTDLMTMTYDASGNLATKTDAIGHVWRYTSYDADGQLLSMTDPNGLVTTYAYDARLRLTSMTEGTETTTYVYDNASNLTKVTLPDASFLSYQFDDADRLIGVTDTRGQKMLYTLNSNGDRIKEETFGTGNSLAMTMSRVIDNLGRVESITGANVNEKTTLTYDPSGNEKTALDPNQNLVKNDYDALDRLSAVTDPDNNPVGFKYDPQDNLVEVSDPRNLKTNYGYSGFDELTKLTSPDTGVTDYTYDVSGNLKTRKDARNITATYQYDALDRIKQIVYPAITGVNAQPAETLAFTYDEVAGGAGAKGRLTTATDGSGSTKYQYDTYGRVTSKSQVVGANTAKTQTISYLPTGQRNEHTLPSGAVVKYSYRADGRVVSIQVNGVTIVSELDYFPFGEVKSWKYNTADQYVRVFDSNGRVKEHTSASATRAIGFDPGSRITSITDGAASAHQWTYGYDNLDRLKSAENAATAAGPLAQLKLGWTFDATGNRKTESRAIGAATPTPTAYTIDAASNKLSQVGALARTYDAVGNTVTDTAIASVYSARNRLIGATKAGVLANYQHNAFGERVSKTVAGVQTQFVYDDDGHLLGEYRAAESTEYLWLGDVPVAVIKPQSFVASHAGKAAGSSAVFFVQPDHLDTPRVIVNASNQPVWRWDSAPFGDILANEQPTASLAAFSFNLRFPGQQFDAETGSHYNYFRDYEAWTGRYLQSDPIGLASNQLSTYVYVSNAPVEFFDLKGLIKKCKIPKSPRGRGTVPKDDRDAKRYFTREQTEEALEANDGLCAGCDEPLDIADADGHHKQRHADGGKTDSENNAAVCNPCHKFIHGKN